MARLLVTAMIVSTGVMVFLESVKALLGVGAAIVIALMICGAVCWVAANKKS